MKKHYRFLSSLVVAGIFLVQAPQEVAAQAFKDHFSRNQSGKPAANAGNTNARVSAAVPSLHQNSDVYMPDPTGPSGWLLTGHAKYRYDALGNNTSRTMLDLSNVPMFKDSTQYDPKGNEILNTGFSWQNNAWVQDWGYKRIITYNPAGKITEIIYQDLDNGAWKNSNREVTLYNTNNFPTTQTNYDWSGSAWTQESKLTFTYAVATQPPTEILIQEYFIGVWRNVEKYTNVTWHDFDKFEPTAYTGQEWMGTTWVNSRKGSIMYDPLGGRVEVEQEWKNNAWVNAYKYTYTHDAKMNFIGSKDETWTNNAWVKDYETAEVLTYNPADQIIQRIYRNWDFMNNTLEDSYKEVYSNFKVLGVAKNLSPLNVKIYPNPATDFVQVQLAGNETASAILTDLTGRAVLTQQISAGNQRVDLAGLAKGTYVLKLETKNGLSVQKIVKQ